MIKKFFEVNFNNESMVFSSEFCLLDKIENFLIAEDFSGNKIIYKNYFIFLYIHDAPEEFEYIRLFSNLNDFYSNTIFYDEVEQEIRYKKIVEENKNFGDNSIPQKMVLVSTFISKLGSGRLNKSYKDGAYYNVSKAFIDGDITKDEFEIFRFLPE